MSDKEDLIPENYWIELLKFLEQCYMLPECQMEYPEFD